MGHVQEPVRSGRRSRTGGLGGLSQEAFNAELRIHSTTTTPLSHVPIPTTMTIASVVGSHGSSAAAHGHVTQNATPLTAYGIPFQASYTTTTYQEIQICTLTLITTFLCLTPVTTSCANPFVFHSDLVSLLSIGTPSESYFHLQ